MPPALVGLGIVGHTIGLVALARTLWFVSDDWDFLLTRGTIPEESKGWWAPHNDHWSTGVIVIYRVLFAFFGMRNYLPYGLVPIAMHAVICVLVFATLRRCGVGPWLAAAATWLLVFFGAGAEAYLWDTVMNLLGSIMFGLGALYAYLRVRPGRRRDVAVWTLLVLGLTFSGTGLTMVALVGAFALTLGTWREAVRVVAVPAAVFALWFALVGHQGARTMPDDPWWFTQIPGYIWTGLTSTTEQGAGVPGSGALLLLVLVLGGLVAAPAGSRLQGLAVAGVFALLVQVTLAAATRVGLSQFASASRYLYVMAVLLLPCVVAVVGALALRLNRPRWIVAVLSVWMLALYTVNGIKLDRDRYFEHRAYTEPWADRVAGLAMAVDNGPPLTRKPPEWFNYIFDARLIQHPAIRDDLPTGGRTPANRLEAEQMFYVGVRPRSYQLLKPSTMELTSGWAEKKLKPGCHQYYATSPNPVVTMETGPDGNEFGVGTSSGKIVTRLIRDGIRSNAREWLVPPGEPQYVASSAPNAELEVTFETQGQYTFCKE